jgi:hypothetical protein
MGDNVTLDPGASGAVIKTDDDGTAHWQYVKLAFGANDTRTRVEASAPLPVNWAGTNPPIGAGVEATALRVTLATNSTGVVTVDDGGANLSVDWGGTTPPIGAGTEAAALRVTIATDSTGIVTVDNAGAFATQVDGAALTALQLIDNIVEVEDTAHTTGDSGVMALAVRNNTLEALAGDDGDYAPLQVNATGALFIQEGAALDVSGATVIVDGSAVTQPVSGTVTANAGTGTMTVDLGSNNDVQGDVAHDTTDSGSPIKIGAKAVLSLEAEAPVGNDDRTDLLADIDGQLLIKPFTNFGDIISEQVSNADGAATNCTGAFAAPGSGKRNYITTMVVHNSSATSGYVNILDGSAGAVLMTIPLPTTGGAVINLPIPLRGADNGPIAYDVSAALSTVYISLVGFQSKA